MRKVIPWSCFGRDMQGMFDKKERSFRSRSDLANRADFSAINSALRQLYAERAQSKFRLDTIDDIHQKRGLRSKAKCLSYI